jgi:diguanylate cyclase (GGDEF)-like protein
MLVLAVALCAVAGLTAPASAADAIPLAEPGAVVPAESAPATLLRPATLHATFRVPRADTALYVGTPWFVRDLTVTVVGPGARRDVLTGGTDLPGRMLGVRLPGDAWQADRIELAATTVSTAAPPYVLSADQLAEIGWRSWSYAAFFGLFAALALFHAVVAPLLRSRAAAWYAGLAAALAGLLVPWLGIVRPPPEISQPLHALLQSAAYLCTLMFTRALFRDLRVGRRHAGALYALVGMNVVAVAGGDVFQDLWGLPDLPTQALAIAMDLAFVVYGVAAVRANIAGARWYLAGTALATLGALAVLAPSGGAFLRSAPQLALAGEALLFALAVATQLRHDARERVPLAAGDRDGLTGIPNRPAFEAALAIAWNRAERARSPLAALLVDVDRFKAYNEAYGHLAGDDVLRRIARVIAAAASRRDDAAARYADDKFVLLLPDTDLTGARYVAEAILERVAFLAIAHPAPPAKRLGVSIGVASLVPQHGGTAAAADLVRRADAALYAAKTMGRNRVVTDEPFPAAAAST